jgi:hypothetical protein
VAVVAIFIGSVIAVYTEHTTVSSGAASFRQSNVGWIVAGPCAECLGRRCHNPISAHQPDKSQVCGAILGAEFETLD